MVTSDSTDMKALLVGTVVILFVSPENSSWFRTILEVSFNRNTTGVKTVFRKFELRKILVESEILTETEVLSPSKKFYSHITALELLLGNKSL